MYVIYFVLACLLYVSENLFGSHVSSREREMANKIMKETDTRNQT